MALAFKTRKLIRRYLLFLAIWGIIVSIFWDFIFLEIGNPPDMMSSNSACPFATSTDFSKSIMEIPILENPIVVKNLQEECSTCFIVDSKLYDLGVYRSLFPAEKSELTLDEFTLLFSGTTSSHAKQHALHLFIQRFPLVSKESRFSE